MAPKYDMNNDNVTTYEELNIAYRIEELEQYNERFESQKKMVVAAFSIIIIFTAALFLPFISVAKAAILAEMMTMLYLSMGGVIAAFMGATAWQEVSTPKISIKPPRMPNSSNYQGAINRAIAEEERELEEQQRILDKKRPQK